MLLRHGWGWRHPQTASHIHIRHNILCVSTLICCPWVNGTMGLTQYTHPTYLGQILVLVFWVTGGVKMMSLYHSWGWQPTQTDVSFHISYLHSVWAHWYVVRMHTVAALHSLTHTTWFRFWGSWSMSLRHGWGWRHPQTASHIHIRHNILCVSTLMCCPWVYGRGLTQYPHPTYLGQILVLVFWVTGGIKMMSLCYGWGWQPTQTASHIHYMKCLSTLICCPWAYSSGSTQLHPHYLLSSNIGVLGHLWSQNDVITSWWRLTANSNCFPHPYWTCVKCLSTLICCPWACSSSLTQLHTHYLLGSDFGVLGHLWC